MSHYEEAPESSQMSSLTMEILARDHESERPIENMEMEVESDQSAAVILSEGQAMQFSKTSSEDKNKVLTQSEYAPKCYADQSRPSPDTKEDLDSVELHRISRVHKARNRREMLKLNWKKIGIMQITDHRTKQFSHRLKDFFASSRCSARFFMTWFSPASTFGPRERICVESIFKFHPLACVVIVSRSLDTERGDCILRPFIDSGYHIMAAAPDLPSLFENTSAEIWFRRLKEGQVDPGGISLSQNLSNLLRLVILFKFGGIYVDTDVIVLRDFSNLSNSIGAQGTHASGQWNRLNNAVLIFDESHPILLQLIRDFTSHFQGSKWGHNGPYLVSRVIKKIKNTNSFNLTILPSKAFYPASWHIIGRWFHSPKHEMERQWKAAKLQELQLETYAVHLWNKQTKMLVVERDSILAELFQRCCVFCDG
ncbi:hypothetical protein O6H91_10G094200 [Diphasiastrum complanatum]|uniref:Uncharacterized protein n=2 Tax=Diphasiastrum complanatum TaxID=34168 RepID=A0ACC2CJI7_DIPCM|nr:hypothetical protein O6H91_10G094200 [Diphasiastrum complanatum]